MENRTIQKKTSILIIGFLLISISCSFLADGTSSSRDSNNPTAIPPDATVEEFTSDYSSPASQEWEIVPFKAGEQEIINPEPGWKYIVIYFGIKNIGKQIDYYSLTGSGPSWLSADNIPLSRPAIGTSYIETKEGYTYNHESLWGNMPMIKGDEIFFLIPGGNFRDPPQFDLVPAIPPGFRLFFSIHFKVAENTTGWTWVVPGLGEYRIENINSSLQFPFDKRPSYINQLGESLVLENGLSATPINFIRNQDGTASIDILFYNPTGYDLSASEFQVHLINSRGWLSGQINYFACGWLSCYHPPVVGPGQTVNYHLDWTLQPDIDDLYMELIYHESLSSGGTFSTEGWKVYELKK